MLALLAQPSRAELVQEMFMVGLSAVSDYVTGDQCMQPDRLSQLALIRQLPDIAALLGAGGGAVLGASTTGKTTGKIVVAGAAWGVTTYLIEKLQVEAALGASRDLMKLGGQEIVCVAKEDAARLRAPVLAELQHVARERCGNLHLVLTDVQGAPEIRDCAQSRPDVAPVLDRYVRAVRTINSGVCHSTKAALEHYSQKLADKARDSGDSVFPYQFNFDCDDGASLQILWNPLLAE